MVTIAQLTFNEERFELHQQDWIGCAVISKARVCACRIRSTCQPLSVPIWIGMKLGALPATPSSSHRVACTHRPPDHGRYLIVLDGSRAARAGLVVSDMNSHVRGDQRARA